LKNDSAENTGSLPSYSSTPTIAQALSVTANSNAIVFRIFYSIFLTNVRAKKTPVKDDRGIKNHLGEDGLETK
jgi:hypothetical protein